MRITIMDKPLMLAIIAIFVLVGGLIKYVTRQDKSKLLRAYPYVIWFLCWVLYNIVPFCCPN